MKKKLNPIENCIAGAINTYPLLYAHTSYDRAKLRVLDHYFNVIGNGLRDYNELLSNTRSYTELQDIPEKYLNGEQLYSGYTGIHKKLSTDRYQFPDIDTVIKGMYTESEKKNFPDVKVWSPNEINGKEYWEPYPNFKEEYSLFHVIDIDVFPMDWLEAGIWYYKQAKEYFLGEYSSEYHYALSKRNIKERERRIRDYKDSLNKLRAKYDTEEQFLAYVRSPNGYGVEYNEDIEAMIEARWSNEKTRILTFIENTLNMLQNAITNYGKVETVKELKWSGVTSSYAHKCDPTATNPPDTKEALRKVWFLDAQWSNCPVEVEDDVKALWTERELGNDNYVYFTTLEDLRELGKELEIPHIIKYLEDKNIPEKDKLVIHWWW